MARTIGAIQPDTILGEFVAYVIKGISRAHGTKRNPIMTRLADSFCDKSKTGCAASTVLDYGVHIRVVLETNGYISYAVVNSLERRIRYITPTAKFPLPSQNRRLQRLISMVHVNASARKSEAHFRSKAKRAKRR